MERSVGRYLLDQLYENGVKEIFGLPGDYVIRFNKLIEEHQIRFINCTREDCAGYAADAYARVRGLGAACITYGVGISIVNAAAQAYVENSPVVIISGAPSNKEYAGSPFLHHLINKSHSVWRDLTQLEIFKQVTVDQIVLDDPAQAKALIDRALARSREFAKPVYIELPRDMVDVPLTECPDEAFQFARPELAGLNEAVYALQELLGKAQRPLAWLGREVQALGCKAPMLAFLESNQLPFATTLLGKAIISEHHPLFIGLYQGALSCPSIRQFVEDSDAILVAGVILSDTNTGFHSDCLAKVPHAVITADLIRINGREYSPSLFKALMNSLPDIKISAKRVPVALSAIQPFTPEPSKAITTQRMFQAIQGYMADCIVVADVGDCLFGSSELILDENAYIASGYFAALGSGMPMAIGAQLAEPARRTIAIVGDGGFQMSALELSTAVRYNLPIIVILLNNHGYGTERPLLEGDYNDLLDWRYTVFPQLFEQGRARRAASETELYESLQEAFAYKKGFYLLEVELGKMDFSAPLQRFCAVMKQRV